jgi:hypothetical protein
LLSWEKDQFIFNQIPQSAAEEEEEEEQFL